MQAPATDRSNFRVPTRESSKNVPQLELATGTKLQFAFPDESSSRLSDTATMDMEEDDDIYAPEEPTPAPANTEADAKAQAPTGPANASRKDDELEEGEEEDEGGEIMDEDDDEDSVGFISVHAVVLVPVGAGPCIVEGSHLRDPRMSTSSWRTRTARSRLNHSMATMSCLIAYEGPHANGSRQPRYSDIKNIPQRTTSGEVSAKPAPQKDEQKPLPVPSADQAAAAASSSKIDINANPVYPAAGKPITQVNIDTGKSGHHLSTSMNGRN